MPSSTIPPRTVKAILSQLSKHLDQHYENFQNAFLRVDTNRNGWISKEEFGDVFKVFNFPVKDEEMDALVDAFDYNKDGRVSYLEFCNTLSNGPWSPLTVPQRPFYEPSPQPSPKPKKTVDPKVQAVKAILVQLWKHLEQHYDGLKSAFLSVDTNRNAWISKEEFADVFKQFHFPITSEELDLLMDAFDYNKDGKVSYLEFCNTMLNGPWAPLNIREPPIRDPRAGNKMSKSERELKLQMLLTSLQRTLEQRFQTVQEAFMHLDRNRSGFISAQELIGVLHNNNVRVSWDDIQLLVDYFDTNCDGLVSWQEFVHGIQMNKWNPRGAGDSRGAPTLKPSDIPPTFGLDPIPSTLNHLHHELRRYTSARYETNRNAFLALNTSRSGAITKDEFGMALAKASDNKLTAELVDKLFRIYDLNGDGVIQFNEYVKTINKHNLE